jgi:hypothetical protein
LIYKQTGALLADLASVKQTEVFVEKLKKAMAWLRALAALFSAGGSASVRRSLDSRKYNFSVFMLTPGMQYRPLQGLSRSDIA